MKALWKKVKLGEIVELKYGKGLPARDRIKGKFPVYGSAGIVDVHNTYLVKGPGIIVGRKGNVGSVYFSEKNFFPIDTVFYIDTDPTKYDLKFIYYMLKNSRLSDLNQDAAVPGLNRNTALMQNFNIPIEQSVQKKIAIILSNYDDLIENNIRRIQILEKIAKIIYDEWFVYFKFPGHENSEMIDSEIGKIPAEWQIKKIKDFGKVITGKTPSTNNKENYGDYMNFIKPPDMQNGIYCIDSNTKISEIGESTQKNKTLPENTIITSCIGTVGLVSIIFKKSQTNQQINALIPDNNNYLQYLYFKFRFLKSELENLGSSGATMLNVSKGKFENIKIIDPALSVIECFYKCINPLFEEIKNLLQKNKNLKKIRDLLLPKLINGEIDVSDLNINISEEDS